jgi:type VII secretion protein EccB
MPSRQDQLHSYQFMVQRVVSALVMRETDPAQSPFRRAAGATIASLLVAVVIAAGYGVYGVFAGSGDKSWKTSGAVIIEKETGAQYVYREEKLHPALNLASALLASGAPQPVIRKVSRKSLADVPRGFTVGVPNLPDSLPDADNLLGMPWSICSIAGKDRPLSALAVGDRALAARGRELPADEGLFVRVVSARSTSGPMFLLWRGRLFAVTERAAKLLSASTAATEVSAAFVNGVEKGQPLEEPLISAAGQRSTAVPGLYNGQVIVVKDVNDQISQYAVVRRDGLAMITSIQATLLLGDFRQSNKLPTQMSIKSSQLTEYKVAANLVPDVNDRQQPPATLPKLGSYGSGAICAVVKDEASTQLRVEVPLDLSSRPSTASRSVEGATFADYVLVPAGQGAVISSGSTVSLITDQGVRYAAAKPEVLAMLGYGGKVPLKLSSFLVTLLPPGPGLDPQAALVQPASG